MNKTPLDLEGIRFEDDFDEYRARACSGGSTYGLMRRQAFAQGGSTRPVPPSEKRVVRQRSKSLIPPSVALPEEKSILKRLCEYTEMSRKQIDLEQRRHSTACLVDARDANHINHLSPIRRLLQLQHRMPAPTEEPNEDLSGEEYEAEAEAETPSKGTNSNSSGDFLKPPANNSIKNSPKQSPPKQIPTKPPLLRRRSFTVTPKGIVNEGDDIVSVSPVASNLGVMHYGSTGSELHLLGKTSRAESANSLGSAYSGGSSDSNISRVLMLGGPGVGKSALTQQFLTSEYMAAQNTSFGKRK